MFELSYALQDFLVDDVTGETIPTSQRLVLKFDAVTSERHDFGAALTERPIEGNAAVSDHKIPNLGAMSISAVITNTPLGDPPPTGSRTQEVLAKLEKIEVSGGFSATGLTYSTEVTRVQDALAELRELSRRFIPLSIRTDVAAYEGWQITSVSAPRTAKDGDSIEFTVDFREVNTVELAVTQAPRPRLPRNRRRANNGSQATQPLTAEQSAELANQAGIWRFLQPGA